jgi:AbrB family looped-hinge helix DNA binding protein
MTSNSVEVNAQGRVVIPAAIRAHLGLKPGSRLIAHEEHGRIVLERPAERLARLRAGLAADRAAAGKEGVSMTDELIADRRAEAAREDAELSERP